MSAPDVSVVIPVHNGERFLREAVESVWAQEGLSTQVIVVDNNSTDRTPHVIRALGDGVTAASESRPGAAAARNHGARLATGRYLALLDADDVWLPGKLTRQIEALESAGGGELVFTHCVEFHDPNLTVPERERFPCRPEPYAMLTSSSLLLSRGTFLRAGDMPEFPIGEFIAWHGWTQTLGIRTLVLPDVLVHRRVHAANTSRSDGFRSGYPQAMKWLLDRRRQALQSTAR